MPFYVNSGALLSDVRLRLEGLGDKSTVLIVEGPDDRRLFLHRVVANSDVVPSGGKTLLRAALEELRDDDVGRILFLTDCDYDVAAGVLRGGPDVVITKGCDVESDLIELGLLERLVIELVPSAVNSKDGASKIARDVLEHADALARALAAVRIAAQPLGVDLEFEEIDLSKFWDRKSDTLIQSRFEQSIWSRLERGGVAVSRSEWIDRLASTSTKDCGPHGKDLICAIRIFLKIRYKMDGRITDEILTRMLRLAVDQKTFERWSVVERIRKWERAYSNTLLAA